MTRAPVHLIITNPQGENRVDLDEGYTWKVGRHEENDVVIPSDIVSRQHAMLQRAEDGTFYLIDMGSRNGSFVNGSRVSVPAALNDGDEISLGDITIKFHSEGTGVAAAQAQAPKLSGNTTAAYFTANRTTVLVTDVRNFTGLTQQIDQSVLCQVIGTWFREAGVLLKARGSWSQKYIGDAIMSTWVHKQGNRTQEMAQILRALVELVAMTATLHERFGLEEPIRIGAGINTGMATIGNAAGSGSFTDYTALGDTVNAAFRLESATKDADVDVLLGEESFQWLAQITQPEPYFVARTVSLKGYARPASAWGANFADLEKFIQLLPA
jgi:adenylate cyclase